MFGLLIAVCATLAAPPEPAVPLDVRISWKDEYLTIQANGLPGGPIEVRYLEAFCLPGSTDRKWEETVVPHKTELVEVQAGTVLRLVSRVEPAVRVEHVIHAEPDGVRFEVELTNEGKEASNITWAQPCIRVAGFTGGDQASYVRQCFLVMADGPKFLHELPHTEAARYLGGQVYVPEGVDRDDVNPRPLSPVVPALPLIGCVSQDGHWLLAAAWSETQELFQGVITCIHSDFRIAGLAPGETKRLTGWIYLLPNNVDALVRRYRADFGADAPSIGSSK